MKLTKIILLLLLTSQSFGQFQTTGKIKKVYNDGFQEIILSPEIRSSSKKDLSDIRIFNSSNHEIPYFIQNSTIQPENSFEEYPIVSKKTEPKKNSYITIALPSGNSNELTLIIANSDVDKRYSILGSNDQQEWFGISDSQILYDLSSTTESSVTKTISYPLSAYKFLRIEFDDKKTLPVNVLKAGNLNKKKQAQHYYEIIPKKLNVNEIPSNKATQIHIVYDQPQIINQLVFKISKPTYYTRQAILYKKVSRQIKRKSQLVDEIIATFELNSNSQNTFTIPEIFEMELYIKIENQDNPPLAISAITFNQKPVALIADLNTSEEYILKTGNKSLTKPEYDLSNFKYKIITSLPQTSIYEIHKINQVKDKMQKKQFWEETWFMWICIGLGGIVILFFTASLIKDLKKHD